jgi:hypothetical protein
MILTWMYDVNSFAYGQDMEAIFIFSFIVHLVVNL